MGKKIDAFIASLLPGVFIWFYLSRRLENRLICFIAAVLTSLIMRKFIRNLLSLLGKIPFLRKHRLRKNTNAAIMRIASIPSEQAHEAISALIQKCYPDSDYPLEVLQQHPALKPSESAIFQAWRRHLGEKNLVICITCRTDPALRAFVSSLPAPKISLIDSDMLSQMIAEFPDGLITENAPKARFHLRHVANLLVNRKNAPRNLLFSASMLMMYLLVGNILYLASSLFLLAVSFLSLRRKLRPNKLF